MLREAITGRRPINSGNQTEFEHVFRLNFFRFFARGKDHLVVCPGVESQAGTDLPSPDYVIDSYKSTATDKKDVSRIDLQKFLLWMLTTALGGKYSR